MTVANIDADFGVSLPAVEPKGRVLVVLVLRSERKPHPPPMLGGHRRWLAGAAGGVNRPPGRVDEPPDFTSFLDVPVHHKSPERLVEPAAAKSITDPPKPVEAVPFESMSKEDRQTFDEAIKIEPTSPREAWELALPLFEAHPAVHEVQELRCRLAKERKFYPAVIEAHCARLGALQQQ